MNSEKPSCHTYTFQISSHTTFFFFQNLKSYLVVVTSPDNTLAQPYVSASGVYLNQRTVTLFKKWIKFEGMLCSLHYLSQIPLSYRTIYISNTPRNSFECKEPVQKNERMQYAQRSNSRSHCLRLKEETRVKQRD